MNLLIVYSFCWLCIRSVFGDCHTGITDNQWLGIQTSTDETWSSQGSQNSIYATIYTNGAWKSWHKLDNADCTDYQSGSVDYFDDFKTVTTRWEAIALFSCSNDAWLIETVYFWDGSAQHSIGSWNPAIFGPFPQNCVYCNGNTCGANNAYDLRLDNDYCPCSGVIFGTPINDLTQGTIWTGTRVDPPDCSGNELGAVLPYPYQPENPEPAPVNIVDNSMNKFAEKLLNYLMITVAMAIILVISALCLVSGVVRHKGSTQVYEKVDYQT